MSFYQKIIRSILFRFDSEKAHDFGIESLRRGLSTEFARKIAYKKFGCEEFGELERFGLKFKNPLGIAAGFDKNGIVVNQLAALGFGFVEVGTVTYEPQGGNERPRMFRLPEDGGLINRLGFNNQGAPAVVERLKKIHPRCVLGVNIGKNKNVPNERAFENYLKSFELAFPVAEYIAVNVSSPNTPDLRALQKAENLEELLKNLQKKNRELGGGILKPLLVKIAPDLGEDEIEAVVDIAEKNEIAGIIATNTTVSRENLKTRREFLDEFGAGGLSGKPVERLSNEIIRKIFKYSKGKVPIVGVGGIFSGADAFRKISAGASLLQGYTGFVYEGYSFARKVNFGLLEILEKKGFRSLDEAVGSGLEI